MGKQIRITNTMLITFDYQGKGVTSLLPYDDNMLYLPLPDTSAVGDSDSLNKDIIYIAPLEEKDPRTGPVHR